MYEADVGYVNTIPNRMFSIKNIILFIICVSVPIMVGLVSGYITKDNRMVFDTINKPALTPPAMVFPIAWSILYVLMGLASFIALINCKDLSQSAYVLLPYVIQLILNFAWSIIFFNMQSYGLAFACLILMWLMIIRTIMFFATVSMLSAWLMAPYILWVTFAGYLNLMIVIIN